ncbi:MAG TPA: carboxypeptidase-like regulatory domain-containing protein, partial [Pyrinomonadaceae bacterium]|nr:carboxypeptidase-like regulatory domain-containing protein [Pyrinomonadaceae bacterium]
MKNQIIPISFFILFFALNILGQSANKVSGVVVNSQNEFVPGAIISLENSNEKKPFVTDKDGFFSFDTPQETINLIVSGKNIQTRTFTFTAEQFSQNLRLVIYYTIAPIHEELVISAETLEPTIERRNEKIYDQTLFSRDDQIFQALDAGINAGQHEGGGKSLEIRRFGFNLDHGGINGGLKVLTDNVQQNQGTQGHGQGYLG